MIDRKYRRPDTAAIVEVAKSFDGHWIVCTRMGGSMKRLKSPKLPVCEDREPCQWNLDRYAQAKRWPSVSDPCPA